MRIRGREETCFAANEGASTGYVEVPFVMICWARVKENFVTLESELSKRLFRTAIMVMLQIRLSLRRRSVGRSVDLDAWRKSYEQRLRRFFCAATPHDCPNIAEVAQQGLTA